MPTTNEPTVPVPVSLTEQQIRDAIDTAYNERCSHILLPLTDQEWTGIVHVAAESVFALLSQSTPTAEPSPLWCADDAPHQAHRERNEFGGWNECTGRPTVEPPRIEDMAAGTTFWARTRDGVLATVDRFWMVAENGWVFSTEAHHLTADRINPSTIRDVQPPAGA